MSIDRYLHDSLSATGFVALSSAVALRLRPDLWSTGLQCVGEFAQAARRNQFASVPHTIRLTAKFAGIEQPVPVLARSTKRLAERIEEVTGLQVLEIVEGEEIKPRDSAGAGNQAKWREFRQGRAQAAQAPDTLPPPRKERPVPPDVEGLVGQFAEPPRPCTACGNRTGAGGCLPATRGEFPGRPTHYRPSADHPRRCLHYVPGYELATSDRRDLRTGRELWPELLPKAPETAKAGQPEQAGAIEKAKAIVADMLKEGPRSSSEILAAGQGANVAERTIQRAAEQLAVVKQKHGNGGWVWALPKQDAKVAA